MMAVAKAMRWTGFALMLLTLGLAIGAKRGLVSDFGPVPVVAVAIILGGTAILLILNDIAIRGMKVQLAAARQRAEAEAAAAAAESETEAEGPAARQAGDADNDLPLIAHAMPKTDREGAA